MWLLEEKTIYRLLAIFFSCLSLAACVGSELPRFKITSDNEQLYRKQLAVHILKFDSRRISPLRALAPDYRITRARLAPYNIIADQEWSRCVYLDVTSEGNALGGSFTIIVGVKAYSVPDRGLIHFSSIAELGAGWGTGCQSVPHGVEFTELNGQIISRGSGLGLF